MKKPEVEVSVSDSLPVLILELGHRDGLEALRGLDLRLVLVLVVIQLLLAQVVDEAGADGVSQHVDGSSEPGRGKQDGEVKPGYPVVNAIKLFFVRIRTFRNSDNI